MSVDISLSVARRFILGKQGLWPGRRWRGIDGADQAMRAIEHLQLDPLVIVARAHDLVLHSRVLDYRSDDWATLTYERRKFFDWGGWLAVRPMNELPHWRVVMRREIDVPRWTDFAKEHGAAIAEMRAALTERGTVSNRDFKMGARWPVDDYRGGKDSALALHYLWRIGDAMVSRREGFERVYALTEAVAPAELIRESDPAEAEDFLLMKMVASDGLHPMRTVGDSLKRKVGAEELATWRARKIAAGQLLEVRVEGWRRPHLALASDEPVLQDLAAGTAPAAWAPLETTTEDETTFLAPLDPVSARGRAKALFGFEYVWEIYKPVTLRRWGAYTMPILWGDHLVGRFDSKLVRTTGTLVINGLWLEDETLATDESFAQAFAKGLARFTTFLGAERLDRRGVQPAKLRKLLRSARSS